MSLNTLENFIENAVHKEGLVPSAVCLVAEQGTVACLHATGTADIELGTPATTDTIYDLASLTKPLVTGLILAILIERGELSLDDPAASFLPELKIEGKSEITIRQLAAHVSGLPAWIPFYLREGNEIPRESVLAQIAAATEVADPETEVIYSDLNFILLGFVLERITGLGLDAVAAKLIFKPLGLANTFFNPPAGLRPFIAANETGNLYEEKMCGEMYPETKPPAGVFRTDVIKGEVHDGNCFFMGGVAGHAGLFSNAPEMFRIACQFLAATTRLLAPETCRLFRENLTPGLNQARSFSFQLAETRNSTAGGELPKESFGHLGFTGTSLWIDPQNERIYILLTNRTHHKTPPFPDLAVLRRNFNSTAHSGLENRGF